MSVRLPKNAARLYSSVDKQVIIDRLHSMKNEGMTKELFKALKEFKSDNFFRLKILDTLKGMDYEGRLNDLLDILENENVVMAGGQETIIHQKMKQKIIELLEDKINISLKVTNINDYDQVQDAIEIVRKNSAK